MRRITFILENGAVDVWQADSVSYGVDAANVILRRAVMKQITPPGGRTVYPDLKPSEVVLIPLAPDVRIMKDDPW